MKQKLTNKPKKETIYGLAAGAEHQSGQRGANRLGQAGVSDARRQDGFLAGEQPEAYAGLLPKLDPAASEPDRG